MKKLSKTLLLGIISATLLSSYTHAENFSIDAYAEKIPGIGLIAEKVKFDGIAIKHFRFDNDKKYVYVKPGEEFATHFDYSVDASKLKTLHLHHLIIGLHDDGPQTCVLHSLGIKDSDGSAKIVLKAPDRPGVYQVRFCHAERLTDEQAQKAWWRGDGPSAKTIVGIVVVE